MTPEQIEAAFNRLRDAKYVGSDQNAQDIATLLDAYESLRARVQGLEKLEQAATKVAVDLHNELVSLHKDHSADVHKCFDEWLPWVPDDQREQEKDFANKLLEAAGVKERVK